MNNFDFLKNKVTEMKKEGFHSCVLSGNNGYSMFMCPFVSLNRSRETKRIFVLYVYSIDEKLHVEMRNETMLYLDYFGEYVVIGNEDAGHKMVERYHRFYNPDVLTCTQKTLEQEIEKIIEENEKNYKCKLKKLNDTLLESQLELYAPHVIMQQTRLRHALSFDEVYGDWFETDNKSDTFYIIE